jgi:hypothetical protein
MSTTKDKFFKAGSPAANDKATVTDASARAIIAAEATSREKKTERLRALRLGKEAAEPATEASPVKKAKKTIRRGRM